MPRFFDDYSNTYLTHDSSAGRKQQRRGWKFRENFRLHYEKHIPDWRRGEMGLASAQMSFIRIRGIDDPAVPSLPTHWKEMVDDATGINYYVNTKTGKRTWVRPGFIPPPPGKGPLPPNMRGGNSSSGGGGGGGMHMIPKRPIPGTGPPPPPNMNMGVPGNYQQRPPPPIGGGGGLPPPLMNHNNNNNNNYFGPPPTQQQQQQQQYGQQPIPPFQQHRGPPPLPGNLPPPPPPPHRPTQGY